MRLTLFLFLCTIPLATLASQKAGPAIASLETGVICPPPTVGTSNAPDTVAGTTNIIEDDPPFISTVNRVPAVLGIGFGAKAMSFDTFGISDVTMTVTHPPMGAEGVTQQSFRTRINGHQPSITFYQFDHAYEVLTGTWTMEARHADELLYRATFEVVPPQRLPKLAAACGFEDLLS